MQSGIEHDSSGDPVNFLHKLDTVECALIGAKFDFDPTWSPATVEVDSGISSEAKYAWYLYHTIALLRQTVRRPIHESKPWFPQLIFYTRIQASLPRLDQYYREIQRIESDNQMNHQRCLLGILHLELLQTLNPQGLPEIHHVWDCLQNGSPAYRNGFQTMPTNLHSKLCAYFHSLSTDQKISILELIHDLTYHTYLQADVSTDNIQATLQHLRSLVSTYEGITTIHEASLSGNLDEVYARRIRKLQYLQSQLMTEVPITVEGLEHALREDNCDVLSCFDTALRKESRFKYLRPEDKLKFVFDSIVFNPMETEKSPYVSVAYQLGRHLVPNVVKLVSPLKSSPGKRYIQTRHPSYEPIEWSEEFYENIDSAGTKKKYYQADAGSLLTETIQNLEQELALKKELLDLVTRIEAYQSQRAAFARLLLELIELLQLRTTNIVGYRYNEVAVQQFTLRYQQYFAVDTIQARETTLSEALTAIAPVMRTDLIEESPLAKTLLHINLHVQQLKQQGSVQNMAHHILELVNVIEHHEARLQHEQIRIALPVNGIGLQQRFPYKSLFLLILAALGSAIAFGIVIGSPYFTFLIVPVLAKYTVMICTVAMMTGSAVALKASADLFRYRLFTLSHSNPPVETNTHLTRIQPNA